MPITSTWTTPSSLDRAIGDLLTETIWDQLVSNELYLYDSLHSVPWTLILAGPATTVTALSIPQSCAISGGADQYNIIAQGTFGSAATSTTTGIYLRPVTAATAFTVGTGYGLYVDTPSLGSGSAMTTVYGLYVANQGVGTNNYGLNVEAPSAGTIKVTARFASGLVAIGDNANAGMTTGLTINQGAADDEILSLKSSDVAHGVTSITETDTYFLIAKGTTTQGSPVLDGFSSGTTGITVQGIHTTDNSARSTSAQGVVNIVGLLKSGSGTAALGTNANIVVVQDGGLARFLVDKEGDIHMDATSNINAWDDHDDLALLESYRVVTAAPTDYRLRFATDVGAHARVLHETGVITLNDDGHHFVSVKGMFGLLIDALRQSGARIDALEDRLAQLALGGS